MPTARTIYPAADDTSSIAPLHEDAEAGRFQRLRTNIRVNVENRTSKKCLRTCGIVSVGVAVTLISTLVLLIWANKVPGLQCPEGYKLKVNLKHLGCYKAFLNVSSFDEAEKICEADNSTITSIPCKGVNDYVINLLNQTAIESSKPLDFQHGVHIGLTYNNGTWEWIDGKSYKYTNWEDGYPMEMDNQKYARIQLVADSKTNKWINGLGSDKGYFVCHKKLLKFELF